MKFIKKLDTHMKATYCFIKKKNVTENKKIWWQLLWLLGFRLVRILNEFCEILHINVLNTCISYLFYIIIHLLSTQSYNKIKNFELWNSFLYQFLMNPVDEGWHTCVHTWEVCYPTWFWSIRNYAHHIILWWFY